MASATISRTCTCQTPMTEGGHGLFYCANCDVPQPQEREMVNGEPRPRVTTRADRTFHLVWERRKRASYGA